MKTKSKAISKRGSKPKAMSAAETKAIVDIIETQLEVQACVDDDAFEAAAKIRDKKLDKLTPRQRIQLLLAAGIVCRRIETQRR